MASVAVQLSSNPQVLSQGDFVPPTPTPGASEQWLSQPEEGAEAWERPGSGQTLISWKA